MNIFVTSPDPEACAKALDDLRVIKMVLESAQLLSTAIWQTNPSGAAALGLYRPTHINHPCAKWVRQTRGNFIWLLCHARMLCTEYSYRFGKIHKSGAVIEAAASLYTSIPFGMETPWPNVTAFPDLPIHEAYRKALMVKWAAGARAPKWTRRGAPEWATAYGQPQVHIHRGNVAPSLTITPAN